MGLKELQLGEGEKLNNFVISRVSRDGNPAPIGRDGNLVGFPKNTSLLLLREECTVQIVPFPPSQVGFARSRPILLQGPDTQRSLEIVNGSLNERQISDVPLRLFGLARLLHASGMFHRPFALLLLKLPRLQCFLGPLLRDARMPVGP